MMPHSSGTQDQDDQAARGRTSRSILPPLSRRALVRSCIACRFTQNSGLVPKKRASRNAVSAVTDRSPLTIAPMRVAGTRKAIASAFTDMPSGARNSSLSTSPGWVVTRLRVDDLDISAILRGPNETDAALRSESCTRQRLRVSRATPTPSPSPQGGGEHTEFAATALSGPRHAGRAVVEARLDCVASRRSMRDGAPVALKVLGRAPGQRLRGQGRVVGAAGAHDGGAEDAEVRHLVREAEAVDHVGLAVVAHAGAAIGMGRGAHGAGRPALHRLRARRHEPLRHLVLDEGADLPLVLLVVGGDADHLEAERIF